MNTFDRILDDALQLPYEQQKMLIKLLQKRHQKNRREEIAKDAQQSLNDFRSGKLHPQSAQDAISELRQFLNEPEE